MPSAAGIIVTTGGMTLVNDYLQNTGNVDPLHPVASVVNWKVIPATAIAAALFYGLEQVNAKVAKGLAAVIFVTSFAFLVDRQPGKLSPLGNLLKITGITNSIPAQPGSTGTVPKNLGGLEFQTPTY